MLKTLLTAVFLFLAGVTAAPAQPNPERAITDAQNQFFDIKKRSLELERMKRAAGKQPSRDYTADFPEIKKDFEKLQTVNEKLFRLRSSGAALDEQAIFKLTTEIAERAARLRANLFSDDEETSPAPETFAKKTAIPADEADLPALLTALDKAVGGFVHNPMFRNLDVVRLEDARQARQNLEIVILTSRAIKAKIRN